MKRRLYDGMATLFGALAVMSPGAVWAADATAALDINSSYVWRGITFNKGFVAQPSLDVAGLKLGSLPLGLNVWSNMDLDDYDGALNSGSFSEVDFTATLGLPKGFNLGFIEYMFPEGGASTGELFLGWSATSVVTPSVTLYYDLDEIDDYYVAVSLSRDLQLGEKTSLSFEGAMGIAGDDFAVTYGGSKGGLYDYSLSMTISLAPQEKVGLTCTLGYVGSFDEEALPDQDVDLYGGVGFSLAF